MFMLDLQHISSEDEMATPKFPECSHEAVDTHSEIMVMEVLGCTISESVGIQTFSSSRVKSTQTEANPQPDTLLAHKG